MIGSHDLAIFIYFSPSVKKIYALYAMPIKDLLSSNHVTINHAGMDIIS